MKARARRAAQELAGELLSLYAERRRRTGHAFEPDSDWQREFEERFPFTETPDQREAIELVKADMEAPQPMDRLICGDVGYGKTEVALRAAFKAANEGKQVLMLVPTTILAQQHYGTFAERLADYPFTIEHVSRFRSAAEQKAAIKGFAEGRVDILIGTHRVLSKDVRAKDLGLLIVDEEQRFGVKQKELLRQLKLRVDVISMSATPIPRTLQMSLAGLRNISVIETPPEGRRPVKTYVGEYEEELVKRAILREHERDGQAFFLHNRVETIEETAERLRAMCPGVKFAVAHGQMGEGELEEVMMDYLRGGADVLVCTSIIESGIDIPQANTLIVEHADAFGLAQLYQIRGRVGRSRERAYAYLLYDSAAALTPEAAQRLSALSDYTELGAGFKIAMRDLEIRGAGNLLGDEQSGHVAALGFELYMQMLDEAVAAAGEDGDASVSDELPEPVRLDVNVDAYVPADYIPYEQAKIEVHRRIAGAFEVADVEGLREELEDRFGPVPEPLENLLALQRARIKFGEAGVRTVSFRGDRLAVTPVELDSVRAKRLHAGAAGGAVRIRALAGLGAGCRRTGRSASRASSGRRTCCWRSAVKRRKSHARAVLGGKKHSSKLLYARVRAYPLECPRRVQETPLHIGARRRFLCLARPGGVRRRHSQRRGRAGRQQPDHESDLRTLDVGRVGLERDDRDGQNGQAGRPRSAGLHRMHRASRSDRGETGQGPVQADEDGAEVRVRTAVHVVEAGGARLPDLLGVGDRRSLPPGREGVRRGSQERI